MEYAQAIKKINDEMINGVIPEFVNSSARDGQAYLIHVRQ